jgi:hypothetical protein
MIKHFISYLFMWFWPVNEMAELVSYFFYVPLEFTRVPQVKYHWSRALVYGRTPAGTASSNPAEGMDIYVVCWTGISDMRTEDTKVHSGWKRQDERNKRTQKKKNPDAAFKTFHWLKPSGRTMALGSTQPVTEMSPWGIKAAGA